MGRPSLTHGLDKEVYQVIRKFSDEQAQYDGQSNKLTFATVYDRIKKSNSSLNRKSKKLLEDSITRVLDVVREDEAEEDQDSLQGDFNSLREDPAPQDANLINRSIVGNWAVPRTNPSGISTPSNAPTPPVDRQDANHLASSAPLQSTLSQGRTAIASPKRRDKTSDGEPVTKRRKGERAQKDTDRSPPSHISLEDLGGVDSVIRDLTELIALPMLYPEVNAYLGTEPPRGVLLYGPPGCGKTMIANAFAARLGVSFIPISAPSVVSGMSGESEKKLRDFFDEARKLAPCLMFIDEIDAITPKRESAQREMEKRIVAQMLTCMDDMALDRTDGKPVIIIAATNRPDSLDPALRRAGRFNKEINLSVPNEPAREKILKALTRNLRLSGDFDFRELAKRTPGFVGADLKDLVSTAGVAATKKVFDLLKREVMDIDTPAKHEVASTDIQILDDLIERARGPLTEEERESMTITNEDFLSAIPKIQPSSKREGFATIPNTTWADIGALHSVRKELQLSIVEPIKRPEKFEKFGVTAPTGVLLWGPPGCGKTLLAKAVANESRANFISVKGPELLNKYLGESERAVRQVFVRARSSVPCVIFFDELDAIVPTRDYSGAEASARVVNTMLSELDGLGSREGIYVIAATNRPDAIDPALLRPGRLGTLLFVDLPGAEERAEILRTLVKMPTSANMEALGLATDGFNGADLESLIREASIAAMGRAEEADQVEHADFETALKRVRRSVSEDEEKKFRRMRSRWGFRA
ncbi:MAG: hypothetical protein M4579_005143 [Chaenotheca gracillima]|nr:MAG: hypothetical protein M4579_005143 [Chaenotheca gracillima]